MVHFNVQVLTTEVRDAKRWQELMNKCPQNDVFFTPQYALLFEATEGATRRDFGGDARLFFYGDEQNHIIYPFFRRKIGELPFTKLLPQESEDWGDIVSPYGYSGPLTYITKPSVAGDLWTGFVEEFHHYCTQNSIIAEFARLHPFIKNHLPLQEFPDILIKSKAKVVYVDLEQEVSFIRKNISKGNKSSMAKARRSGVEIRRSRTKSETDAFYQLYIDTMERNNAERAYFFSKEFFDDTFRLLDENVQLFSAWYKDRIIAASLFLLKGNLAHYYLGASDTDFLYLRPNNLLFYQALLWAKEQGYKIFNLGGGYGIDDGLFRFKASFSKTTADFYTYSRIHDAEIYRIICQARDDYDKSSGNEIPKSAYFPEYRR